MHLCQVSARLTARTIGEQLAQICTSFIDIEQFSADFQRFHYLT